MMFDGFEFVSLELGDREEVRPTDNLLTYSQYPTHSTHSTYLLSFVLVERHRRPKPNTHV